MYAIIVAGGKQHKVEIGQEIRLEKIAQDVGSKVELSPVLLISSEQDVKIGQPILNEAKVTATIIEQGRGKKILVFKKKRRKGYKVKRGHRQPYTLVRIENIAA